MGKRGPRPKPTAIKKLEGNPGRRPLPENEPKPRVVLPPVPDSLSEVAAGEWKRASEILHRVRVLTDADLVVFRGYCVNFAAAYEAEQIVKREGITLTEYRGDKNPYTIQKEHPAHAAGLKAWKLTTELARELGLTPASRTRIQSAPEDTRAPLEQLRNKLVSIKGGKP